MKCAICIQGEQQQNEKQEQAGLCARAVHFISHLQQPVPHLIQPPVPPTSCNVLYAGEDMKASLSNSNKCAPQQWLSPLPATL